MYKNYFINYAWKAETLKSLYKPVYNARASVSGCAWKPPAERMENNILK